ncbi:MAG: hypothetical protein ACRDMV_11880 [Streptosporangiales bacterium]
MDEIGAKVKATGAALLAGAAGVWFAPWLVKAAIIAVFLLILAVVAAARAHDMSVLQAASIYGGKAIVAVGMALAVVLVELPVRGAHRVVVRYDLALKVQVAAMRLSYLASDHVTRFAGWDRDSRTPRPALRLAAPPAIEQLDQPTSVSAVDGRRS